MLNSTPEYVSAHQRDLAAMKPDKGAAEALAAKRAERKHRLATVIRAGRSRLRRILRPQRTADAASRQPLTDG